MSGGASWRRFGFQGDRWTMSGAAPKIKSGLAVGVEQENSVDEDDEVNGDRLGWGCGGVLNWAEVNVVGVGVNVDGGMVADVAMVMVTMWAGVVLCMTTCRTGPAGRR